MKWNIQFTNKAAKQTRELNEEIVLVLQLLVEDLKDKVPIPGKHWHNYGKLEGKKNEDKRHCHMLALSPTLSREKHFHTSKAPSAGEGVDREEIKNLCSIEELNSRT